MADERIPVRLVPRTSSGEAQLSRAWVRRLERPRDFTINTSLAERTRQLAQSRLLDVQVSPTGRVDAYMAMDEAAAMFGVDPSAAETVDGRPQPKHPLIVPPELRDLVEFAYVPSQFKYFAEWPAPPPSLVFHLGLDDVARALNAFRCHRRGWTGRDIVVAMADTGFLRHPHHEAGGYSIVRTSVDAQAPEGDVSGHGTAMSANLLAIAPDCRLYAVRNTKTRTQAGLALELCLAAGPKIMTQSWGFPWDDPSTVPFTPGDGRQGEVSDIEAILARAAGDGVVVLFAAGNDGDRSFPASVPSVIAVGGATIEQGGGIRASSGASSFASELYPGRDVPDICGVMGETDRVATPANPALGHIMLPVPENSDFSVQGLAAAFSRKGWGVFSGTSSATPQVAGVVALMLQANPNLSPMRVKEILRANARDVEAGTTATGDVATPGADRATGAGLVDALRCCETALVG